MLYVNYTSILKKHNMKYIQWLYKNIIWAILSNHLHT